MSIIIPLYLFLYAYYFLIFVFVVFFFFNIKNLFHTGSVNILSFFITFLVLSFAVLIIFFTLNYAAGADWQQTVTLFDKNWINTDNIVF